MKPYLLSLAVGLLAGVIYSLLNVRSPAPPVVALIGLLGMLMGEQALPAARHLFGREQVDAGAEQRPPTGTHFPQDNGD